jgi:ribosomal protein L11 methyltransferase
MTPACWKLTFLLPADRAPLFSDSLADLAAVSVRETEEGGRLWSLEALAEDRACLEEAALRAGRLARELGMAAPEPVLEEVPAQDWLAASYAGFPPLEAGRFFVHGSHHEGAPPAGRLALKLDAATAFGTGEHGSTRGCLLALDALAAQGLAPGRVLDMGCGSGILAMAAKLLWPGAGVLAVDIDPEAARVSAENAAGNALEMDCLAGDGYRLPEVGARAPYDLILANILANPLIEMAPDLAGVLAPEGAAVLAGLLEDQADAVIAAHAAAGLKLRQRRRVGAWATLVLGR